MIDLLVRTLSVHSVVRRAFGYLIWINQARRSRSRIRQTNERLTVPATTDLGADTVAFTLDIDAFVVEDHLWRWTALMHLLQV
jgi:hypothetical protein